MVVVLMATPYLITCSTVINMLTLQSKADGMRAVLMIPCVVRVSGNKVHCFSFQV